MATTTKIIFNQPEGSQVKYSLSREGEYTLGTAKSCDITLDDDALDQEHGKLVADETNEGRWFLQIQSTKAILFLEDGTSEQIGNTSIEVSITKDEEADVETEEDDEEEEPEEEEEEQAEAESESSDDQVDDDEQAVEPEDLRKAHQMREFRNAIVLIVFLALLSFAAGVAWRLLK